MGIASVIDSMSIVCNCFFPSRAKTKKQKQFEDMDKQLADVNGRYDIHIIKVDDTFHISNLYPSTDQVERWSIFIIGNDKTFIHTSIGDFNFKHSGDLLNRQGTNILPKELHEVFEPVWTQTLNGEQLQFYLIMTQKLYLVNTYPFHNAKKEVIGSIMFVRPFVSERSSFDKSK